MFCRTESDIFYIQNASLALVEASSSVYRLMVSEQYLVKALIEASLIVCDVLETIFKPIKIEGWIWCTMVVKIVNLKRYKIGQRPQLW